MKDWKFLFEKFVLQRHKFEPKVRKALSRIRGGLFVDIGANIGFYTYSLRDNFDVVVAFEPNPEAFAVLKIRREHVWPLDHATFLHPLALSNHEGEILLFTNKEMGNIKRKVLMGGASILQNWTYRPGHTPDGSRDMPHASKDSVHVRCDTYDAVMTNCHAALVKIDVEGAEFMVLDGMRNALKGRRVDNLMIELHDRTRRTELENLLRQNSFGLHWIDPDHVLATQISQSP